MKIEQAMKILHPDTTIQALAEVAYLAGFRQSARIEACDEACVAVCDEIEKLQAENASLRDLLKLAVEDLKEQSKYFGHCHYCTISNEHGGCKLGKSIKASVCNVWQWQHADKLEKFGNRGTTMICDNCIKADVCLKNHIKSDLVYRSDGEQKLYCEHFKDKDLVVELPCEVGDMVYVINSANTQITQYYITEISIAEDITIKGAQDIVNSIWTGRDFEVQDFGKRVFLTQCNELNGKYCHNCGQALDWSDNDD